MIKLPLVRENKCPHNHQPFKFCKIDLSKETKLLKTKQPIGRDKTIKNLSQFKTLGRFSLHCNQFTKHYVSSQVSTFKPEDNFSFFPWK